MAPLHVDGAIPHRAGNIGSPISGSTPLPSVEAVARSREAASAFVAQIEMSMLQSLAQLGASDGEDADGGGGEEDAGSGDLGLGAGFDQSQLMATLFTGLQKRGASAASIQAQLAAIGGLGGDAAGAGSSLVGSGAGDEALLAQSLVSGLPTSSA